MKRTPFILLAMLALASCSHTRDLDIPEAAQDAVGFDVYTRSSVSTKAGFTGDIDEASFKVAGFGVYAYVSTTPDFMRNQHVSYSGGSWVYSPMKYWPNQETDKISFYAYAPHVASAPYTTTEAAMTNANNEDGILYIPGTDATGDPVIVYKTAADPSNNVDLMFGVAAEAHTSPDATAGFPFRNMTKLKLGEKMKFNFKHALTKLAVNVDGYFDEVNGGSQGNNEVDANTRIVIESVSISAGKLATTGTLNLNNTTANTPKWELGETPATVSNYTLPIASNLQYVDGNATSVVHFSQQPLGVTKTAQSLMGYGVDGTTASSLMFVPHADGTDGLDVTIVYHVITRDARLENGFNDVTNTITKNIATLGANAFQPGYLTTLNLHLGLASVAFDAVVSDDWGDGGGVHGNIPSQISMSVGTECFYFWAAGHNDTQTFTATCGDTDVSASVVWSSDNEDVATVSADGLTVTSGSSYGVALITGTYSKDWGGFTEIATVTYPVYVNQVSGVSSMTATKTQIAKDEVTTVNAVIEYNEGIGTFGIPPLPITFEFDDTGLTGDSRDYLTLGSVSYPSANTVTANVTGKAYGGEGRIIKAVIPAAYTTGGADLGISTKVNCAPPGTTGYLFQVYGKKVYVAKANLMWEGTTVNGKWKLMEHAWSTIEQTTDVIAENYGVNETTPVRVGLFGVGTSGWNGSGFNYNPYCTDADGYHYVGSSLIDSYANCDWGVYNTTGGRHIYLYDGVTPLDGSWRTPTNKTYTSDSNKDWPYLLERANRGAFGTVNSVKGIIILPDNWTIPEGIASVTTHALVANPPQGQWTDNTFTSEQWALMEAAGAVFLPRACLRVGTSITSDPGGYWSVNYNGGYLYYVNLPSDVFTNLTVYEWLSSDRHKGRSVRLIREVD